MKKRARKQKKKNKQWKYTKFLGGVFPSISKSKNKNVTAILITVTVPLILWLAIRMLSDLNIITVIQQILTKNFGEFTISYVSKAFLVAVFLFLMFSLLKKTYHIFTGLKENWSLFWVVSITATLFLVGVIFINSVFGAPPNEWKLFYGNGTYVADIECGDGFNKLIYNHAITCKINSNKFDVKRYYGSVNLKLFNGSLDFQRISSEYTTVIGGNQTKLISQNFFVPEGSYHMVLNLDVWDEKEKFHRLETTTYIKFTTLQGDKEREKNFLTFFLGLLFLCIITIPPLVLKVIKEIKKIESRNPH